MKTREEIENIIPNNGYGLSYNYDDGFIDGYIQCQQDMADKIKEVYEQGLSDGYACMPSTISPLNKQD